MGRLAASISVETASKFMVELADGAADAVHIGCFNSRRSVSLSCTFAALEQVTARLHADGHLTLLPLANVAYHSRAVTATADHYEKLLRNNVALAAPLPSLRAAAAVALVKFLIGLS
jgi:hypothetical protein